MLQLLRVCWTFLRIYKRTYMFVTIEEYFLQQVHMLSLQNTASTRCRQAKSIASDVAYCIANQVDRQCSHEDDIAYCVVKPSRGWSSRGMSLCLFEIGVVDIGLLDLECVVTFGTRTQLIVSKILILVKEKTRNRCKLILTYSQKENFERKFKSLRFVFASMDG